MGYNSVQQWAKYAPGFGCGTAAAGSRASHLASTHNAAGGVDEADDCEDGVAEKRTEAGRAGETAAGEVPGYMLHKGYVY